MSEREIQIPKEGGLTIEPNAIFAQIKKDVDDTKQTMHYVILILLVMVAGMIIGLLTAIWQSSQSHTINITTDKLYYERR